MEDIRVSRQMASDAPAEFDEIPNRAPEVGPATTAVDLQGTLAEQEGTQPPAVKGESSSGTTAPTQLRPLKLVVTLKPTGGRGYQTLIALGADGCDPLFQSSQVSDLRAALDEVPALMAEAEVRWQVRPRYPMVEPGEAKTTLRPAWTGDPAKPGGEAVVPDPSGTNALAEGAKATRRAPVEDLPSAPAGQLPLFE